MNKAPLIKKIECTIIPTVEAMGFELVRVLLIGTGKPVLQIMAERADGSITLDECARLSQAISAVLDVENVLNDASYYLEVGSPGIDRPLTRLKDFDRYAGQQARIEVDPAIDGRKRFNGCLKGLRGGDHVLISLAEGDREIPFHCIQKAKLVVEDNFVKNKPIKKKF